MDVADKLQIKAEQRTRVLRLPPGMDLGLNLGVTEADGGDSPDVVILFVTESADLSSDDAGALVGAAGRDAVAWVAYPKAGQLGTDLNRDSLAAAFSARGLRPVRQISIDTVWSALRFRPSSSR